MKELNYNEVEEVSGGTQVPDLLKCHPFDPFPSDPMFPFPPFLKLRALE